MPYKQKLRSVGHASLMKFGKHGRRTVNDTWRRSPLKERSESRIRRMRKQPKRKPSTNCSWNELSQCVMARLSRDGVKYQKNFGLKEYRSWAQAEKAAVNWLEKAKKRLGKPRKNTGRMNKRNTSGFVGIWATTDTSKGGDINYSYWRSRWAGCKLRGGISFSVDVMGCNDAFLSAWIAREYKTTDRKWIARRLKTFKKTKKSKNLLSQRLVKF